MIKIKQCNMVALSTEDLNDDVVVSNCHQVVICPQASDYVSDGYDETQPFGDLIRKITPPRFLELLNTNEEDINKNPFKIASDRIISEIQKEYPNLTEANIKSIVLFEFLHLGRAMSKKDNFEVISDRFEINESDSLTEKLYKIFSDVFPFVELKDDILTSVNNLIERLDPKEDSKKHESNLLKDMEEGGVAQIYTSRINMIVDCLSEEYPSLFKNTIANIAFNACDHIEKDIAEIYGKDAINTPDSSVDYFMVDSTENPIDKSIIPFNALFYKEGFT